MGASDKVIRGKDSAREMESSLAQRIQELEAKPHLAVILVGNDSASHAYVRAKKKACRRLGIDFSLNEFETGVEHDQVLQQLRNLNSSEAVSGIIVQLPLPSYLDQQKIIKTIDPAKDADALHPTNLGLLLHNQSQIAPATPKAVIRLLEEAGTIAGKDCAIVNDSLLVGKPLALMLIEKKATVSVCHKRTKDLKRHTSQADVVIVGVGQPSFLGPDMIKQGATVIDVGINRTEGGLTGDVVFEQVKRKADYITPVPGGVGPVTVAMLLDNVVRLQERKESS